MFFRLLSLIPGTSAWRRARLRTVMRGYRVLMNTSRLGAISDIKNALTESPLAACKGRFSTTMLGAAAKSAELALRQYLLIQRGGVNLNRALLRAAVTPQKAIAYPMPEDWRQIVRLHGFGVSEWRCKLLWAAYVFGMWGYGAARTVRILAEGVRYGRLRDADGSCCAWFLDLSPANFPQERAGRGSHDIISWYAQWPGRNASISSVRHGVLGVAPLQVAGLEVSPQRGPVPALCGARELLAFAQWSLFAIMLSAIDALRGRWWHAVMLSHAAVAAQARHVPAGALAKAYMFHNSGWIYRPLWTYEVECKGSDVVMYFYSTNSEPFKLASGYPPMYYGYRAMNWPRYLVWDDYQADFVRRATNDSVRLDVVGPIWFQGKDCDICREIGFSVAIFDVTPHRASRYAGLGFDTEFYTPPTVNSFLTEICEVIQRHNVSMLWKRKRNIGRVAHPHYRHLAERLGQFSSVTVVDADVSALKVISACTVTISLPFTSTALLARQMGKPSVYYDPTGKVQPDDRAAHGIPVLSGPAALDDWLQAQLQGQGPAGM
ncbi:MAG: polysaccharide biosynthesis PFTS motif protein [Rhodocyclaceae bacterium]|nr:polysaccharide biosynthesis PFTS motif protein [Rhodocyclaceae bacterium]